jgi:hypothetical protein
MSRKVALTVAIIIVGAIITLRACRHSVADSGAHVYADVSAGFFGDQ